MSDVHETVNRKELLNAKESPRGNDNVTQMDIRCFENMGDGTELCAHYDQELGYAVKMARYGFIFPQHGAVASVFLEDAKVEAAVYGSHTRWVFFAAASAAAS